MESSKDFLKSNLKKIKDYNNLIEWSIFISVAVCSVSAWISSTSIWSELPIIVSEQPESWRIPSILSALAQTAQIGALVIFYSYRWLFPKKSSFRNVVYFKLITEIILLALFCVFWKIIFVIDEPRSVGLYLLFFSLSLLDGISTVSYLPYIGEHFAKEYIIPNYLGESFASTIPSSMAFFQGLSHFGNSCQNPIKINPHFSIEWFTIMIMITMLISLVSFIILDRKYSKKKHNNNKKSAATGFDRQDSILTNLTVSENEKFISEKTNEANELEFRKQQNQKEKYILLIIAFFVAFLMYGLLPGLQSYSTLPYGTSTFNLSINLGNLILPIAVITSIFSYRSSVKQIVIEFLVGLAFSIYLVFISILSPCPPLVSHWSGGLIAVTAWIIIECLFIRLRCKIAERLELFGNDIFLILGVFTLLGQIFGGLTIYVCVDVYRLLKDKPSCVFDFSYCS